MEKAKEELKPKPINVLWVSSNQELRNHPSTLEMYTGGKTTLVLDGEMAQQIIEESAGRGVPYDLVVSDLNLPAMSGAELVRALRREGNNVPFCLINSTDLPEAEKESLGKLGGIKCLSEVNMAGPHKIRRAYQKIIKGQREDQKQLSKL